METLGSLIDKLTIVQLKIHHSRNGTPQRQFLTGQSVMLQEEINVYIHGAVSGRIPAGSLTFDANKIHTGTDGQHIAISSFAGVIAELSYVNCDIWHLQEKVYNFPQVPADQKDEVIHQLAILNLQRTECIDAINQQFRRMIVCAGK